MQQARPLWQIFLILMRIRGDEGERQQEAECRMRSFLRSTDEEFADALNSRICRGVGFIIYLPSQLGRAGRR